VPPFRPAFSPQPRVFSRSSLLPATHDPLPTFPRPLFSWSYKSLVPPARFRGPLFSYPYKSLFPQALCIHIYTKRPGVTLQHPAPLLCALCGEPAPNSFPCHTYKIASRKSFPCHTSEKPGVSRPLPRCFQQRSSSFVSAEFSFCAIACYRPHLQGDIHVSE